MPSVAILIGTAGYERETELECCQRDVEAMTALLKSTDRFDRIEAHLNLDADAMRDAVRAALPADSGCDEIFFYFSGHGAPTCAEFFLCGTDCDPKSPNLTGVSHAELHMLFRTATPETLVTVTDACFSGTLLVKREGSNRRDVADHRSAAAVWVRGDVSATRRRYV